MKLWERGSKLDPVIEEMTTGTDYLDDLELVPWDCRASAVHAEMLTRIGLLEKEEEEQLVLELNRIVEDWEKGEFIITPDQEDCHTAIEERLTQKLGTPGLKIHLGRSRNDQVLTALRLYSRDRLNDCQKQIMLLADAIDSFVSQNGDCPLPGLSHTRNAMPSSVGMWAGGYSDALRDDCKFLQLVQEHTDQCPLGTGAGYGVPLPLDREYIALRLGFKRVQRNPVYAQLSRGKFEASILHALTTVMYDLSRFSADIILFSMPVLGFFDLSEKICTGSSMMPQKRNPDALELIRGRYSVLSSLEEMVKNLSGGLISGYHRDMQLAKRPLMQGFETTIESLRAMTVVVNNITIVGEKCLAAMTDDLYAFQEVCGYAMQGIPFRQAYRTVAEKWK